MTRPVPDAHRLRLAALAYLEVFPDDDAFVPFEAEPEEAAAVAALLEIALRDGRRLTAVELGATTASGRLALAVARYTAAFGSASLPYLFAPPQTIPMAAAMLTAAVESGRPLDDWDVMAAHGIGQPPKGAIL